MKKKWVREASGRLVLVDAGDPRPAIETSGMRAMTAQELAFQTQFSLEQPTKPDTPKSYRFSVLKEIEVARSGPWSGEIWLLTIVATPEAMDIQRAKGGSLRDRHEGDQIGSTMGAEFGVEDGINTLYVTGARFLSGSRAQEIEQGIQPQGDLPPILQNVSVRIIPLAVEETPASKDGPRRVRVVKSEYVHTAFVPDPAQYQVGIDRELGDSPAVYEVPIRGHEFSTREKEIAVKKKLWDFATKSVLEVDASDPRPALTVAEPAAIESGEDFTYQGAEVHQGAQVLSGDGGRRSGGRASRGNGKGMRRGPEADDLDDDRQAEVRQIELMAEEAGLLDTAEGRKTLREWLEKDYSIDRCGRELFQLSHTNAFRQPGAESVSGMTDKEVNDYRFSKAALIQLGVLPKSGLEWRVHQHLEKEYPNANPKGGMLVPVRLRRESLAMADAVTPGKGAELVQAGPIEFLDLMRNAPILRRMGARFIPCTAGSLPFVRRTAGAIAYFTATGKKPLRGEQKFQIQEAVPHRAVAVNTYSLELLQTASRAIDTMMLQDVVEAHAPLWDWMGLYGPGGKEPLGVLKMKKANGASAVHEIDCEEAIPTSAKLREGPRNATKVNGLSGSLGYLFNGDLADVLAETPRVAGTTDYILKEIEGGQPDEYRRGNYRAFASNQVGVDGESYDGLFGPFQHLIFVGFGAMELLANPYEMDEEGIIKVTAAHFVDNVCVFPEAFSKLKDARLTNGA